MPLFVGEITVKNDKFPPVTSLVFSIQFYWGSYGMMSLSISFIVFNSANLTIAAKSSILPLFVGEIAARMTYTFICFITWSQVVVTLCQYIAMACI